MGNLDYWKVVDSRKLYKNATIKKMNEYYNLLNYICKLITEYNTYIQNPKKNNRTRLVNYSSQCDNFYKTIHNSINGCKPYLQLLDDLKMIYEVFRLQQIDIYSKLSSKDKDSLLKRIKHLTTFKNENKYFVSVGERYSFDDKECLEVKSKDEQIGEKIALQKSKNPVRGSQTRSSENAQRGNPGTRMPASPQPKRPPTQPTTLKQPSGQLNLLPPSPAKPVAVKPAPLPPPQSSPSAPSQTNNKLKTPQAGKPHQNGPGDAGSGADGGKRNTDNGVNGGSSVQGDKGSKSGASGDGSRGSSNTQVGSDKGTGSLGSEPGGAAGGKGGSSGEAGGVKGDAGRGVNGGDSAQGDQGKSSDKTGSGADSHADKGSQGGSGNQTKPSENSEPAPSVTGTSQSSGMTTSGTSPPSTLQVPAALPQPPPVPSPQQPDPQKPDPKQLDPQQPGSPQPQPQPQPADPSGPPPQTGGSSSGSKDTGDGSSDPASNTSEGSFDFGSSFLEFIFNGTEKFNKASEFIEKNQQTFKDAKDKISGAYNSAVDNLKSAYNVSSDYFNSVISNITSQLNQVDTSPKSGGNQTGPGNPTGGGNPSNQLPPSQPQNPAPTPTKDSSQNPPLTPPIDPLHKQSTTPPSNPSLSPPDPPQQKQPHPQSRPITQQPTQTSSSKQIVGQFVKSLSSDLILKKPWNIFPTTWNGSGDCKPEIKFMNTTLVCCTSEQCSLTGILITLVLIPIILSIAYKYLSFGSSKKSEKKSMKRVINFHDGNRKTKIIISSYDNKKKLKPVINSVGKKKDTLLNIYKLIQADPMPFINLFFLLIFFVYKRKRDTIE
ncbi:PIR protein CIR protein [Plasmodium vinckei petteri]|uniref:PIR protein CIR protein n=1 Tax=Plasmodium vinckei petteri TaxID=138298 RepID=A0A6V7SUW5_PLAVN|nr:PIR protein CIR protein [Plasmodium vinckei petteri]